MIMQRDVFTVSVATLILCQLLSGQVHAAADSKNNSEMVRVPGGVFLMGSSDGPEDERPQHQVNVGEFFHRPNAGDKRTIRPISECQGYPGR